MYSVSWLPCFDERGSKPRGDRGERRKEGRVGGTVSLRAAASGEHKVQRTPEKKTGFDVVKSSPKNGGQVRMPGGEGRNKTMEKKYPQFKS